MHPELRSHLQSTPPMAFNMGLETSQSALFHYTNFEGLSGIVRSGELWATNIHYLNDHTEFNHALEIAKLELSNRLSKYSREKEAPFLQMTMDRLSSFSNLNVFAACFSELSDDLGQWRGYASSGGVAIGFRFADIQRSAIAQSFKLLRCIYDDETKKRFVAYAVDEIRSIFMTQPINSEEAIRYAASTAAWHLVTEILAFAPAYKHHGFTGEREWRLVSAAISGDDNRSDYRVSGDSLIPYFRFDLLQQAISSPSPSPPSLRNLGIGQIVMGPSRNQYLNSMSVGGLLRRHKAALPGVLFSAVPYRTGL